MLMPAIRLAKEMNTPGERRAVIRKAACQLRDVTWTFATDREVLTIAIARSTCPCGDKFLQGRFMCLPVQLGPVMVSARVAGRVPARPSSPVRARVLTAAG